MARVLFIEDYPGLQELYKVGLEIAGHQVTIAADPASAFEILGREEFDVMLVDFLLPKMNGLEFLAQFKPLEHPKTQVWIFSNFIKPETVEAAKKLGVTQYLEKTSLTPHQLAELINTATKPTA